MKTQPKQQQPEHQQPEQQQPEQQQPNRQQSIRVTVQANGKPRSEGIIWVDGPSDR